MNRTVNEWAGVKVAAVFGGSDAQARNVLQMALDDIAALAAALHAVEFSADGRSGPDAPETWVCPYCFGADDHHLDCVVGAALANQSTAARKDVLGKETGAPDSAEVRAEVAAPSTIEVRVSQPAGTQAPPVETAHLTGMTEQEQIEICKALAVTCMWGQGGIASVFLERLDHGGPAGPKGWYETFNAHTKAATREHMGIITDKAELDGYLRHGYHIVNFDEDGASLFNPPPMNGLCKYVSKELAEPHRRNYHTHTRTAPASSLKAST